jgi:hypothetical protein
MIASVGGAGVIIVGVSTWVGKIWAEKLMNADKAKHEQELARLRSGLEKSNQIEIEGIRVELSLLKDHRLRDLSDKVVIYRHFIDLISEYLADFEKERHKAAHLTADQLATFNARRLRLYGYISLTSPQAVIDAQDQLVDYLLNVANGNQKYDWKIVRDLSIAVINECRKDIGLNPAPIQYNGTL